MTDEDRSAAAPGTGVSGAARPGDGGEAAAKTARGADLARAALEAARARNAARLGAAGVAGRRRRVGTYPPGIPAVGEGSTAAPASAGRPQSRIQRRGTASLRRTRWSGAGPDGARDPQVLGSAMDSWVRTRGSAPDLARATLFGRWAEVVGRDIASHASPVSLVDGDLLVQAESTAWATQLRMLAPTLVQRINGRVGRGTVARIRFQGPTGPSWRFGNRSVPGRGQRDTYG